MSKSIKILVLMAILAILFVCCEEKSKEAKSSVTNKETQSEKLKIAVTIPPQAYFVKKIGGDKVNVYTMIAQTFDPHTYEPTPKQLSKLSDSDIYIKVGNEKLIFEQRFFDQVLKSNKKIKVVNMSDGIELREFEEGEEHHHHEGHHDKEHKEEGHDHGHSKKEGHHHDEEHHDKEHKEEGHDHAHNKKEGHHHDEKQHDKEHKEDDHHKHNKKEAHHGEEHHDHHDELDPHVWVSVKTVPSLLKNIKSALEQNDPKNKEFYQKNYDQFIKEIDQLDHDIENILSQTKNKTFLVYHPSWGYFAKDYGLKQLSIEVDAKEPSAKHLKEIIDFAKENKVKVIFVQKGFSQKSAKVIATEINAQVVEINPLEENWMVNMKKIAESFQKALN